MLIMKNRNIRPSCLAFTSKVLQGLAMLHLLSYLNPNEMHLSSVQIMVLASSKCLIKCSERTFMLFLTRIPSKYPQNYLIVLFESFAKTVKYQAL